MVVAYVLVKAAPGRSRSVAESVAKIEGVKSAHAVTGRYDVIAQVEAADISAIGELVLTKVQAVEGVQRTETAIAI